MQQQLVWAAVIVGAIVLFWLPVIAAMIRGTDPLWPVVLLTVLTPLGGFWWFVAWIPVFAFPPPRPAHPRRPAPQSWEDDPRTLFGGVPSDGATRHY